MKKNLILIATALALSLPWVGCKKSNNVPVTTTTRPSGPVELKLKWPVGRHMVYSLVVTQNSEVSVPGRARPIKQTMDMGQKYGLTVLKEREGGGREVEMEFLSTRMGLTSGEQTLLDFDSTRKSSADTTNPAAVGLGKMVGARLRCLLNASNRVEAVEGVDDLRSRLSSDANSDPTGILSSLTEDYFKQMMDNGRNLPPKPVEPGDSWPVQSEIAMGNLGTMVMDYTFTFEHWEKHDGRYCARISFEGTIKSKVGQNLQIQGMSGSLEDSQSSGVTWFDLDMGMFVENNMKQDMKLLMTIPAQGRGNAPAGQSQTITDVMHQLVTVKLESVE
ncbi:MAG: DUF6263 family protein [Verrucomicrobiota bacterium]|jgi:hypothetical protein